MRFRLITLCLSILVLAIPPIMGATDDIENSTPTAWWIYTGQTLSAISNTITTKNARIINIAVDTDSLSKFTVTYVRNSGSYAKSWWYYVGIDAATVSHYLAINNARLISLNAYDIGGGDIRFAVVMIPNTGNDAKAWWWYYDQVPSQISNLVSANGARLIALQSYTTNGTTLYAVLMIANSGTDARPWWWYYSVTPQTIKNNISANHSRVINFTPAGNGTFNAVLEGCSSGCPSWWWYYGADSYQVLSYAQNDGARVLNLNPYVCGTGVCFATTMINDQPADIKACDPNGCISEAKLRSNICGALSGKVVGYSCEVGGLRPWWGGTARTATDPPALAMSPDLVTNIASVSKTITAVAILQLLHKRGITIDATISPYLYSDWSKGPNIGQITFRELLTHTSGFGQLPNNECGYGLTYSAVETIIAGGVSASDIGKPQYGNCNFALMRELMPNLLGINLLGYANGSARASQSASIYINYINSHVFQPVSVPTRACKPPSGTHDILSYPYPAGTTPGTDWGDWTLSCGGGGWVISGDEIFRVINDLATGNTLLTSAEKKSMFSNCLGWDCAVRSDCPDPYVCKNGDLTNGLGTSVWTYAGVLGCNVPVVVVVNSPLPSPYQTNGDIIELVANAYKNAKVDGTAQSCP
jgi:hypothetical protein